MILPGTGTALAALLFVAPAAAAPVEPAPDPAPARVPEPWRTLADCESDRTWDANTGNGYYGGLQFSLRSWRWVGGTGMPHEASPAEQVARAEELLDRQGWGAWPVCSIKVGLR
jgi:hypothetical protein